MNLLETLLAAQGGDGLRQMSARFGLDTDQTQSAIDALLPMLAGAVSRNASTPDGLEGLLGALGSGRHQRYVDEPSALDDPETVQDGNAILGHMFGSKEVSREVAARASAQTGIGADILKQMLPLLAALLMGGLSKGASGGGLGAAQGSGGGMFGAPDANGGGLGGAMGGGLGDVLGGVLGGADAHKVIVEIAAPGASPSGFGSGTSLARLLRRLELEGARSLAFAPDDPAADQPPRRQVIPPFSLRALPLR